MGDNTGIEWTEATWNPTTGCDRVSAGCDNCYALGQARRLKGMGIPEYQGDGDPRTSGPGFGITEHPHRLAQPLRWTRPRRIFVNSMSDLFHDGVSDEFIARVFAVMAPAEQHTFLILKKRDGRMRSLLNEERFQEQVAWNFTGVRQADHSRWPLRNVWLGVSAEDQRWADIRIPALLRTPAAVRFVSAEPLLGPIIFDTGFLNGLHGGARGVLDWVITGGESGPRARPAHPGWFRAIRDQCAAGSIAYLHKQNGEWQDGCDPSGRHQDHVIVWDGRHEPAVDHWAKDEGGRWVSDLARARYAREAGARDAVMISRVGKKAAGRELDDRTYDGYPTEVTP